MLMLLYGKDTYRSLQKAGEIRRAFSEKTGGEVVICEGETITHETLRHHLQTDGLFSRDKLIIVKNLITEGGVQKLRDLLPLIQASAITAPHIRVVIFERDTVDGVNPLIKKLIAATAVKGTHHYPEHTPPKTQEVRNTIAQELANAGKTIEPDALLEIAEATTDGFLLANELNKLLHAEDRHITKDVLFELAPRDINDSIFHLTDAIAEHRAHDALSILSRLLESGDEPLKILSILHWHARIATKINSYLGANPNARQEKIAQEIKERTFSVKKTLPFARSASQSSMLALYENLLETDRKIKRSAISPEALLARLVYRMSVSL